MAKISQTVKEIIQIVVFLLVVGILLTAFVIYPLNRTSAIMGRADDDVIDPDRLLAVAVTSREDVMCIRRGVSSVPRLKHGRNTLLCAVTTDRYTLKMGGSSLDELTFVASTVSKYCWKKA